MAIFEILHIKTLCICSVSVNVKANEYLHHSYAQTHTHTHVKRYFTTGNSLILFQTHCLISVEIKRLSEEWGRFRLLLYPEKWNLTLRFCLIVFHETHQIIWVWNNRCVWSHVAPPRLTGVITSVTEDRYICFEIAHAILWCFISVGAALRCATDQRIYFIVEISLK